jgi:hypothetical protein
MKKKRKLNSVVLTLLLFPHVARAPRPPLKQETMTACCSQNLKPHAPCLADQPPRALLPCTTAGRSPAPHAQQQPAPL